MVCGTFGSVHKPHVIAHKPCVTNRAPRSAAVLFHLSPPGARRAAPGKVQRSPAAPPRPDSWLLLATHKLRDPGQVGPQLPPITSPNAWRRFSGRSISRAGTAGRSSGPSGHQSSCEWWRAHSPAPFAGPRPLALAGCPRRSSTKSPVSSSNLASLPLLPCWAVDTVPAAALAPKRLRASCFMF